MGRKYKYLYVKRTFEISRYESYNISFLIDTRATCSYAQEILLPDHLNKISDTPYKHW